MKRILVVGDSWSSAIESDTKANAGWPSIMNIPVEYRQAVAGTTAAQWDSDVNGMMTKALNTPTDVTIMSLLGNDAFALVASGNFSLPGIAGPLKSLYNVALKLSQKSKLIVLLYTDPFDDKRFDTKIGITLLNIAIQNAVPTYNTGFFRTSDFLTKDDFSNGDIHPNHAGHVKIATELAHLFV